MTDKGLTEPLLDFKGLNNVLAQSSKPHTIPINAQVNNVFTSIQTIGDKLVNGNEIEGRATHYILTRSGNLLNYSDNGKLTLWSLLSNKLVYSEDVRGISVLYETPKGSKLFIGYINGTLESRDPNTQQVLQQVNLRSAVKALVSDDKNLYVSLKNGKIVQFPTQNISSLNQKVIRHIDRTSPITHLRLSRDETFLVGYVDIDQVEMLYVFNIIKPEQSWSTKLDLSAGELREDPNKLVVISEDCLNIFIRGENNKGVCMYSLFDGSIVQNVTSMHTNYINQILVTKDSKRVITCSKDRKIKVWDWIKSECLATLTLHEEGVEAMILSEDETLLFSGSYDKTVNIWSMYEYVNLATLQTKIPIRSLYLSGDNDILLATSNLKQKTQEPMQAFWVLEDNADAFRIRVELKNVSNCYVTPNNEYLVTMNGNSALKIWNLRSRVLIENHKVNCQFRYNLRALNGTRDSESIFFQKESSEIVQWSCSLQQQVHTFNHGGQVQDIVITSDDRIMYCAIERQIYKWDLQTKQELCRFQHNNGYFLFLVLASNDQHLFANGSGADIFEYNLNLDENQELKRFDIIKDSGWVNFELSPDGVTLIQTNQYNSSFWVCNLKEGKVVQVLNKHSQVINFVGFTKDGKYLITRSKAESIIWETSKWKALITIQEEFGIVTSSSRYVQAIIHDGLYKSWSDEIFSSFSDDFTFTSSTEQESDIVKDVQEVNTADIKMTGNFNNLMKIFIGNIGKKSLDEKKYLPYLYKTQIQPFKMTLAHYYAFYNNAEFVSQLLQMGTPYIEDVNENTPLDNAIQKKSYESATIILDYIMRSPHLYGKLTEEKIVNLIEFAPSNLKDFFDSAVKEQQGEYIPSFGTLLTNPITFRVSQNNFVSYSDIKHMIVEDKESDEPLVFKTIQIPFNMQPGSEPSINFHRTLSESELTAFRSESVQAILTYKWDLVKKIVYINGLIYLFYMSVLFAFIQTYHVISVYFLIAFGFYFMGFEILQMCLNKLSYLGDFWNIFDFLRVLLLIIFIYNAFKYEDWNRSQAMLQLLGTLNFLSWVRALSFLRLFQKTRIFIRLLVEVIYDMIPFMIVLIGAVLGISLSFEVINDISMLEALKHNYRLTFGDFETDNYTTANWALFIIGSVLIPLIMLNMLVAIMSDTYARVMSDVLPSDFLELNQMILEQEEIQFWNRRKGQLGYLHYVTPLQRKEGNDWEGQIQKILALLQQQNGQSPEVLNKLGDKIDLIIESQKVQFRDTNLKFDEQKKRFDRIQQELEIIMPKQQKDEIAEEEEDSDGDLFDEEYINDLSQIAKTPFENFSYQMKQFVNYRWNQYSPTKQGKLHKNESIKAIRQSFDALYIDAPDKSEIESLIQEIDLNGDGLLSKKEIYVLMMRLRDYHKEVESELNMLNKNRYPKDAFTRFLEPKYREIFEQLWAKYDSDSKGYIPSKQGTQLIKEFSKKSLNDEEINDLLKSLDRDGNGQISKDELKTFISENKYLHNEDD
ncbi:wd-40 repeat protein [Stylonychia lemnae]|uniref:Wd-40 repeat protein n=1 Tax=Stylonychia lemnae TaxID=5949 RepID=A0A078AFI2_STYLE|nr:wd-40 repeat protein [Stylonychia lemnae]|eukprot:CDW80596.1 wd-40 repeat protein [Stylonychia lemnae]